MDAGSPTLDASCRNCVSYVDEACARGLAPDEGAAYCGEYEITNEFRDAIASAVLRDGGIPMVLNPSALLKLQAARRRRVGARAPAAAEPDAKETDEPALGEAEPPKEGSPRIGRHSARRAKPRRRR